MKKLLQIALLKVRLTFKERTSLMMMFVAPIVFIVVISFGFKVGGSSEATQVTYPIGIVNLDNGAKSIQLVELLKANEALLITEGTEADIEKAVQGNKLAIGILIPEGFSDAFGKTTLPVELMKLQDNENTMVVTGILNNLLQQMVIGSKAGEVASQTLATMNIGTAETQKEQQTVVESAYLSQMDQPQISVQVETATPEVTGEDNLSSMAIGILVLFIMFFVSSGAGAMFEEKEMGTWNRVKSTPTKDISVLGGYVLGNFILGWIQVGTLIIFSKTVFHINWGNSPVALVLLFSAFLLAIIGLGTALSSFVKTKNQLASLTPIIIMPTSLIAGCMWPAEIMPKVMIQLANFVPQRWVLIGMTDLITRGKAVESILLPTGILMIFAVVFFMTGLGFMNVKSRQSA